MKKILPVLIATSFLSGCATSTLSQDDTRGFKNEDIYSFVKQRFIDTETNSFFSIIDASVNAYSNLGTKSDKEKKVEEYEEKTTKLLADGKSAIFEAGFNKMDYSQLYRPKTEVLNFCAIKGGELRTSYEDKSNFISNPYGNAFKNILIKDINGLVNMGYGFTPTTTNIENYDFIIDIAVTLQQQYKKKRYDQAGAKAAYNVASINGAFGSYVCVDTVSNQPLWSVIIAPFTYESATSTYASHALKILISPDKGK